MTPNTAGERSIMACRWTELIVDASDPEAIAGFWAQVLGWEKGEPQEEGLSWLRPPRWGLPLLAFVEVPEAKQVKNRLHIDVSPTDRSRDEEVDRIVALGATRVDVGQEEDASWVVLADPEGNEFCVLGSRVDADLDKPPWPGMA